MILSWEKEAFIQKYNELKSKHLLQKEIAQQMFIGKDTLKQLKRKYGVHMLSASERELTNGNGVNREMLNEAKKIGLTSHLINRRIRVYGWTPENACKTPKRKRSERRNGNH